MSQISPGIQIDVSLSVDIQPHIPQVGAVDSSVLQQIGRFDIFRFWEQRVMSQIVAAVPGAHHINLEDLTLSMRVDATPEQMPDFISISHQIAEIVLKTPLIPEPAEVDAWAYFRQRWSSNRTLAYIQPGDGNFELNRAILIDKFAAIELLPGTNDRWRKTEMGKKL